MLLKDHLLVFEIHKILLKQFFVFYLITIVFLWVLVTGFPLLESNVKREVQVQLVAVKHLEKNNNDDSNSLFFYKQD